MCLVVSRMRATARGRLRYAPWVKEVEGERCRPAALLIRVKAVQSEPFFANPANDAMSSQLDIMQERG